MLVATAVAVATLGAAAAANAGVTFVGSWEVDQGPEWSGSPPNGPLAYTGQEAAALLFGGSASDYVISTVDNLVADINDEAWYSVIGVGGGSQFAQDYSNKYLGQYYGPTYTFNCCGAAYQNINAASSYVNDNATGSDFTNFAFRVDGGAVPEPASWALMIGGFGLAGAALRRRRQMAAAA
jgi:hypothetical protein